MRRTRETELASKYPLKDVTEWIGNSEDVAKKHYLMATDETFTRASKESSVSMATFMATNMATQGNESEGTKLNETQETPLNCVFVQEKEKACFQKTGLKLPSRGVEPLY